MVDWHLNPLSATCAAPHPFVRHALARAAVVACVGGTALLTTGAAWALALGPVRVQSALGQPLRAEIALSQTTAEELDSLMVRVAPQEVFRAHGLEFGATAALVQARLERRGDAGVIVLSSPAPVDDLFVDLVLEADWSAGSFARSYTLLLDPPSEQRTPAPVVAAPAVPVQMPPAQSAPQPAPVAAAPTQSVAQPASQTAPQPAPAPQTPSAKTAPSSRGSAPAAPAAPERRAGNVTVQRGDTLGEIVRKRRPRGVSMDQMLVAVLQANPDAFLDGNMNRLRTGAVLKMPTASEAQATDASAAREMVLAQSRDFNALRRGLATHAPRARVDAADRASAGRVQTRVTSNAAAAAPSDKLTLSKAQPSQQSPTQAPSAPQPAPEDRLAAQKQAQTNQDRLQQLQRNLEELQGISVSAPPPARAQAQADVPTAPASAASPQAAQPVPQSAAAPVVPPIAAQPPAAPAAAAPAAAPAPANAPTPPAASAPASEALVPPQAPTPVPAATTPPAAAAPTEKPAMHKPDDSVSVRPAAEPSADAKKAKKDVGKGGLIAQLALLVGAAASTVLVGLLGWLLWQRRKAKVDAPILDTAAVSVAPPQPAEPVAAAAVLTPLEQADAHLAQGQTAQAIDVLQKALQTDPADQPVLWKLAQIQADQRDLGGLEMSARALLEASGGQGTAWEAVLAIGQSVDPDNPFYNAAAAAAAPSSFADALAAAPAPEPAPQVAAAAPAMPPQPSSPPPIDDAFDLDLDLPAVEPPPAAPLAESMPGLDLDLDLGDGSAAAAGQDILASIPQHDEPVAAQDDDAPEDPSLGTKLDLAREFHSFGDTEGARALIDEVLAGAKKNGTTYARALQLQAELPL